MITKEKFFITPIVCAEVGLAHDGSLAIARSYIIQAAKAGATAIKFQAHDSKFESSRSEGWRAKFPTQDSNRYDYWQRTSFSKEHWSELIDFAHSKNLLFIISVFSYEQAHQFIDLRPDAFKIASGEIHERTTIECIVEHGYPIIISTGWPHIMR